MKKKVVMAFLVVSLLCSSVFISSASSYAEDPQIKITSPTATDEQLITEYDENKQVHILYTDSLLISVKLEAPKTIEVAIFEQMKKISEDEKVSINIMDPDQKIDPDQVVEERKYQDSEKDTYSNSANLSYYTRQIDPVTPGLYRIQVKTIKDGGTQYVTEKYVAVRPKSEEPVEEFSKTQGGTFQFIQNLLKSIFN